MATFTVAGHKLRTASTRRFIVVKVKTDKWAVMEPVEHRYAGSDRVFLHDEVARQPVTGFRMIFDTHAEAFQAVTTADQKVVEWSKAGVEIVKRSDSYATARTHALSVAGGIVLDTSTGEAV